MKISICLLIASCLSVFDLGETWDNIKLSTYWPQSIFRVHKRCHPIAANINTWTIHGLWPDTVQCCNPELKFNISELNSIRNQMNMFWPDLYYNISTCFWKHEWDKHGTCAASLDVLNTELKYFNATLALLNRFNITQALRSQGIIPSDTKSYRMDDFVKALKLELGLDVTPICSVKNDKKDKSYYITRIEFLLNKRLEPNKFHFDGRGRGGGGRRGRRRRIEYEKSPHSNLTIKKWSYQLLNVMTEKYYEATKRSSSSSSSLSSSSSSSSFYSSPYSAQQKTFLRYNDEGDGQVFKMQIRAKQTITDGEENNYEDDDNDYGSDEEKKDDDNDENDDDEEDVDDDANDSELNCTPACKYIEKDRNEKYFICPPKKNIKYPEVQHR